MALTAYRTLYTVIMLIHCPHTCRRPTKGQHLLRPSSAQHQNEHGESCCRMVLWGHFQPVGVLCHKEAAESTSSTSGDVLPSYRSADKPPDLCILFIMVCINCIIACRSCLASSLSSRTLLFCLSDSSALPLSSLSLCNESSSCLLSSASEACFSLSNFQLLLLHFLALLLNPLLHLQFSLHITHDGGHEIS